MSAVVPPGERPELGPVLASLGQGDVLVVARLDRLSRSVYDSTRLMREAEERGWALVCLDPEFDLTTAAGRMVFFPAVGSEDEVKAALAHVVRERARVADAED